MYLKESEIESWLKSRIEGLGGLFLKFVSPGTDGVPDRIAIFPDGRVVFVELKTATGKLSAIQNYQIRKLMKRHQQVCVIYGMAGAVKFLKDAMSFVVSSVAYTPEGEYELEGGDA